MSSILDAQLMIGDQADYVTPATVGRALEIDPGETMDYKPNRRQGEGIRVGSKVARAARRSTSSSEAGGDYAHAATRIRDLAEQRDTLVRQL